jgi:hypothetical protein
MLAKRELSQKKSSQGRNGQTHCINTEVNQSIQQGKDSQLAYPTHLALHGLLTIRQIGTCAYSSLLTAKSTGNPTGIAQRCIHQATTSHREGELPIAASKSCQGHLNP